MTLSRNHQKNHQKTLKVNILCWMTRNVDQFLILNALFAPQACNKLKKDFKGILTILNPLRKPKKTCCSNFLSAQILFYNSNCIFRILIQFLEFKFSFSAHISPFLCNDLQFFNLNFCAEQVDITEGCPKIDLFTFKGHDRELHIGW